MDPLDSLFTPSHNEGTNTNLHSKRKKMRVPKKKFEMNLNILLEEKEEDFNLDPNNLDSTEIQLKAFSVNPIQTTDNIQKSLENSIINHLDDKLYDFQITFENNLLELIKNMYKAIWDDKINSFLLTIQDEIQNVFSSSNLLNSYKSIDSNDIVNNLNTYFLDLNNLKNQYHPINKMVFQDPNILHIIEQKTVDFSTTFPNLLQSFANESATLRNNSFSTKNPTSLDQSQSKSIFLFKKLDLIEEQVKKDLEIQYIQDKLVKLQAKKNIFKESESKIVREQENCEHIKVEMANFNEKLIKEIDLYISNKSDNQSMSKTQNNLCKARQFSRSIFETLTQSHLMIQKLAFQIKTLHNLLSQYKSESKEDDQLVMKNEEIDILKQHNDNDFIAKMKERLKQLENQRAMAKQSIETLS